jgi:DNA mismatch endonuclease, patch repair protein
MRLVRSRDTKPEIRVRSLLHSLGFRFRLQRKDLPGNPDIVLPKHSTVIFVHGCFWHRHKGCQEASMPATNQDYWIPKFNKTVERDKKNQEELRRLGWNIITLWECEIKNLNRLTDRLMNSITSSKLQYSQDSSIFKMAAESQGSYQNKKPKGSIGNKKHRFKGKNN